MRNASRRARRSVDRGACQASREIFKLVQGSDAVSVVEGNTDRRDKTTAFSVSGSLFLGLFAGWLIAHVCILSLSRRDADLNSANDAV
jgi:hypothetical protein